MIRILIAVVLLIIAVVVAYGILTFATAAIHHGRHQRREFDRDLNKACGYEAGDGHLRDLPAPGLDIYTDRNVWLPRTPPLAEVVVADITTARARYDAAPARVLPACSCGSYSHWQADHDKATSKLLGPQPEPVTTTDLAVPDSTFVKALLALPLDRVHLAFDGVRQ